MRSRFRGSRVRSDPRRPWRDSSALSGGKGSSRSCVYRSCSPSRAGIGPEVDQEQEPGGGEALDQAVEPGLRLGIDPVQVLHDEAEGLDWLRGAPRLRASGFAAALGRIQGLPLGILPGHVEERQEGRQGRLQGGIEGGACP